MFERGYASMTIRSVARSCGVAVGTIYNYYPSKDHLTASFVLKDWLPIERELSRACEDARDPMEAFDRIYTAIQAFAAAYQPLFGSADAARSAGAAFRIRHGELRRKLACMIERICMEKAASPSAFLPEFVAEALLSWAAEGRAFADVRAVLCHLFDSERGNEHEQL